VLQAKDRELEAKEREHSTTQQDLSEWKACVVVLWVFCERRREMKRCLVYKYFIGEGER
jgi:hypothetical protein